MSMCRLPVICLLPLAVQFASANNSIFRCGLVALDGEKHADNDKMYALANIQ